MIELNENTKSWTYLENITISSYGDKKWNFDQPYVMHARLPNYNEIYQINNSDNISSTRWLYDGHGFGCGDSGYWTSSMAGLYGIAVYYECSAYMYTGLFESTKSGIRPVIVIRK